MPFAVQTELQSLDAPPQVRKWISSPPAWLEVHEVPAHSFDDTSLRSLDKGEREAIELAATLPTDTLLLIDDREGVKAALRKGLDITGTIGILDLAAKRGLLDLAAAFDQLRQTNFHRPEKLMERMLAEQKSKGQP
ncbi:MAG: DUF3368 domain-containing protein [Bryobacteraceae bacterium]|nr:DUF3368 domain-containing protein [Bryobacteraceae bacterium]